MRASLIIIGTELTRGIIQDKHGPLVSKELTKIGVHVSQIVAIPDDGTIQSIMSALMKSNDILIITGGLGPTADDMTRSVIAASAGVPLIKNERCWNHLVSRMGEERARGANEKQAYIPEGFEVIDNPNGTAPGFYGYGKDTLMISLPGPPREMEPMFYSTVLPLIRKVLNLPEEKRDEYSSFLTPEAKLEELCSEADSELEWGTRFQDYKISLYVSGKDKAARDKAIESIRAKVGPTRLVDGNTGALEILISELKERGATVSCAESCTGGLASSLLTSLPGSSAFMLGAVTSYATDVKKNVLKVSDDTIEKYGVISKECALEMAEGVRSIMDSDYSFSITGVAGPDLQEDKSVGTLCFGFSSRYRESESIEIHLRSWGRESVRRRASIAAFILLSGYIRGESTEEIAKSWVVF